MTPRRLSTVLILLAVVALFGAAALFVIGHSRSSGIDSVRHDGVNVQATVLSCTTDRSVACAAAFMVGHRTYQADVQGMSHTVPQGTQLTVLVDRNNEQVAWLASYALNPPANAFYLEFVLAGLLVIFAVFCLGLRAYIRRRLAISQ